MATLEEFNAMKKNQDRRIAELTKQFEDNNNKRNKTSAKNRVSSRRAVLGPVFVPLVSLLALLVIAAISAVVAFRVTSTEEKLDAALEDIGVLKEQNTALLEVFRQLLYNSVAAREGEPPRETEAVE
jgi:hypothetical protein